MCSDHGRPREDGKEGGQYDSYLPRPVGGYRPDYCAEWW